MVQYKMVIVAVQKFLLHTKTKYLFYVIHIFAKLFEKT